MLNNKELFNNIKTLCDGKGIKITNLEKELGFGGGIISRWGNNADPSLSKIVDIADYFNVTIDELIGRNSNNDKKCNDDDLVMSIIKLTEDETLKWEKIDDYKKEEINDKSYEDLFDLYDKEIEIYKAKYNGSFIFLITQYNRMFGKISDLVAKLFLQPDYLSYPVLQESDEKITDDLWINVRKKFLGIPDEWKAEKVKQQIIDSGSNAILNDINNIKTEYDFNLIKGANDPAIKEIINMLSEPKAFDSVKQIKRLLKYFEIADKKNRNSKKNNLITDKR